MEVEIPSTDQSVATKENITNGETASVQENVESNSKEAVEEIRNESQNGDGAVVNSNEDIAVLKAEIQNGEENKIEETDIPTKYEEETITETSNNPTKNETDTTAEPDATGLTLLHPNVKTTIERYISGFGITNYTIDVSSGSEKGDNFSGLIGKVEINGLKNGTPVSHNWIVKTAPNLQMYRNFLNIEKFYNREVFMYSQLFPLFKSYQAKTLKPFDNHAEYILSSLTPLEETVVMQDMKSLAYVLRDRQTTLDLDHVKLVMKAYGKLHALSFALKTLNNDSWQWVKSNTNNVLMEGFVKEAVYNMQKPFMDKIVAVLDPKKDAKYLGKFKKFSDNFIDVYLDLIRKPSDFEVVLHGDCWVNNMLWKYQGNKPEKVCLIDWQQSSCGSPASDLTYFLFTSTSKEFRDKHYESMLRLYHYSLCEHLNEFGANPELCFTFEALQNEMKSYSMIGLYYSLILLGIVTKDKDEIPEWRDDSLDLSEFSEKFLTSGHRMEEDFKVRVRGVIVDFYEKGYLDIL